MKKHDEDLNTTLIFVGYPHCSGASMLTWVSGRSVLCRHLRLHHPGPPPAPVRPSRRDRRSPQSHALQDGQRHVRWQYSLSPSVDRRSPWNHPCSSDVIRQSRRLTLLRLPRDAREAMAEPICVNWYARHCNRTQPGSPTEAGWHHHLVLRPRDGVPASDATSCALVARLRPVFLPLED